LFRFRPGEGLHNLTEFTLSAWVRLDALPTKGNGATLINKGPEEPVQHFWWWIGYPPAYELTLELGDESNPMGRQFPAVTHSNGNSASGITSPWFSNATAAEAPFTHYRDDTVVGTETINGAFDSGTYDVQLGTYSNLHGLNGALQEVKIWDRALHAEELQQDRAKGQVKR